MKNVKLSPPRMQSYTFRVVVEPDPFEDGTPAYHAYIPAIQGCRSWGYTVEEALENVEVAAKMLLELMIELGEKIPQDAEVKLEPQVTINLPQA